MHDQPPRHCVYCLNDDAEECAGLRAAPEAAHRARVRALRPRPFPCDCGCHAYIVAHRAATAFLEVSTGAAADEVLAEQAKLAVDAALKSAGLNFVAGKAEVAYDRRSIDVELRRPGAHVKWDDMWSTP